VVEPTLQGRAAAQSLIPHVPVFSNIDDLLNSLSVTFVDITAQPAAHCALILKAAAAGINVICEKPFVTSLEALRRIEQVRRSGGPIIAACHNWYFAPAIRRALELVAAGKVGEPQRICFAARRSQPAKGAEHWKPAWRQFTSEGGGILGDLGYHGFYLASRIFRSAPILVRARPFHHANNVEEAESAAYVQLDYGETKQAELTLSWVSAVRETLLQVYGSSGNLSVEGETLSLSTIGARDTQEQFESLTADSWHSAWIGDTLDWFIEAVETGDRDTSWQDIQWSVSALHAAHDSMKSGKAVATSVLSSTAHSE
jgi:predicted dehydrogenase